MTIELPAQLKCTYETCRHADLCNSLQLAHFKNMFGEERVITTALSPDWAYMLWKGFENEPCEEFVNLLNLSEDHADVQAIINMYLLEHAI